jgi:hypothetical protein
MPIQLVHEDDCNLSLIEFFDAAQTLEVCYFCDKETRFWSAKSNTPVCPSCARTHHWKHLPRRLQWLDDAYISTIRLNKRKIELREKADNLEALMHELILSQDTVQLDAVRQQLRSTHQQMAREGLVVKRPVVFPEEMLEQVDHSAAAAGAQVSYSS